VEDAVRRAAGRDDRGGCVLERLARDDLRGPQVAAQEIHREPAGFLRGLALDGWRAGMPVEAGRADPEEIERGRHRVRRELAPARARAGAGDALELVEILVAHLPDGVRADGLEHVLDGDVAPAEAARCDRAVVEREAGKVEARRAP
jgi:hypothetical protein